MAQKHLILQKIDEYLQQKFTNPLDMYRRWDFDEMKSEHKLWELPIHPLYIYVFANHCKRRRLHAKIGCTSYVQYRLLQSNRAIPDVSSAESKRTKTGTWKLMFWIRIPPIRNYSSKMIKKEIQIKRGWKSKCSTGMNIASSMGLEWKITREIMKEGSRYYSKKMYKWIRDHAGKDKSVFF